MTFQIHYSSGGTSGPFQSKLGAISRGVALLLGCRGEPENYIDIFEGSNLKPLFRLYRSGQYVDYGDFLLGISYVFKDTNGLLEHLREEGK